MDHFNDLMDSQADAFYDNIRALVVVFLIISLLLPMSYVLVAYFRDIEESALSKDDLTINQFVIGVCTFSLSVSLLMYLMLPFSIFANEVLVALPDSYYVQWINTDLLTNLFFSVAISSKFVCLLIPFCFFLLSSHSVFHSKKAVTSRFMDASVYLIICFTAYFGCLATLVATFLLFVSLPEHLSSSSTVADLLPRFLFSSQTIYLSLFHILGHAFCCFDTALVIIQRTVSSAGLVLLLVCMPLGVIRILLWALTSSVSLSSHPCSTSAFGDTIEAVDRFYRVKDNTCRSYINKVNLPLSHPTSNLYDSISQKCSPYKKLVSPVVIEMKILYADFNQLAYVEDVYLQSRDTTDKPKRQSGGHKSVCSFFVLTLLVALLIVGTAYTTANVFVLLFGLVFGYSKASNLSPTSSFSLDFSIGRESASKFGWVGAVLQVS
ncbi:unnamed protein product [Schistocephalus solidus]|uniref:LMBR1-like membrane protein n=1 Tax=Schistocephalus solidus TaxID=70667 RepID=A0A183SFT0_SCHSO|nr:unnamed protein product [Schistocephalus solidus]